AINDLIKNFEAQKGVMSVSLVYHQCERASELDKELVGA
ncbi:MAG: nitrate reductase NapAB chaperone NapD, partial [Flavobacteriales bacterium]